MSSRKSRKSFSTGRHSNKNKRHSGTPRGKGRYLLEGLEQRVMLASFSEAVPGHLTLALAKNEAVSIVATSNTAYTLTLNSGTWSGSDDGSNVSGNGKATLTVGKQFTQVDLTDMDTGASVKFTDSGTYTYGSSFNIALGNSAAGSIEFSGATSFAGANSLSASTTDFIVADSNASITTASGSLTLSANQQTTATSGSFDGIDVDSAATIQSTSGAITLQGKGGTTGNDVGININGATVQSATGAITLQGAGGATGSNNDGVEIQAGGKVQATGTAGPPSVTPALLSITGSASDGVSAAIAFNDGIVSSAGNVSLTSTAGDIVEVANTGADVTGATVSLTTTHSGDQIGGAPPVGGSSAPLKVNATTLLNATTADGFITLANTTGNMPLGALNAGAALIELTSVGAITDGNPSGTSPNLTAADGATLTTTGSNSAIGTSAHPVRTAIDAITATSNDGGIYISDSGPVLGINSVLAKEGGKTPFPGAGADGSTQVILDGGPPVVTGTDNVSVTAAGSIVLIGTLTAPNTATVTSTGGNIVEGINSGNNLMGRTVNMVASGSIGQQGLPILFLADNFTATTTNGSIYLSPIIAGTATSVVAGGAGSDAFVTTSQNLVIGTITAPDTVNVQENGGALVSSSGTNITAPTVDLTARYAIGSITTPFTVTTSNLQATVTSANFPIEINNTKALTTVSATTDNSDVNITFTGGSLVFAGSTGLLTASGAAVSFDNTGGNVVLGAIDANSITASGAITAGTGVKVTGSTVTLTAGTGIGTMAGPIDTSVTTLNATTTTGDIFVVQSGSFSLNAASNGFTDSTAMTGSDIDVSTTTGDITVGVVSALGTITLDSGGAVLAATVAGQNLLADTLDLTAMNGVGTSAAALQTAANTLTANGGAGGGVFLANDRTLALTSASATGGAVSITTIGDLDVGSVTATGQAVTLSATGALIDPSGPALNVTAQSATLSGSSIGAPGNDFETTVSSLNATASNGGIYVSDLGTGSIALTATATGAGADIDFTSAGSIVLNTVTAKGNTVTLTSTKSTGTITTATPQPAVNITAQTLDIVAPGGVGTSANPLEILVAQIAAADGGSAGVFMNNAGPVSLTQSALTAPGTGTLTFDAASITIQDLGTAPVSLAAGRSLLLKTETGPIVFLNQANTIQTSGTGTITVEAGTTPGSGGLAVLGNLTTAGGNILVTADGNVTLGLLNAGTGNVTVQSASGVLLDGNGPTSVNVIAGSATLSGNAPTARQLELDEENAIAGAAGASAEYSAEQTSADAFASQLPVINSAVTTGQATVASDQQAYDAAKQNVTAANDALIALQALQIAAGIVKSAADFAKVSVNPLSVLAAVPLTGDLGADTVKAAVDDIKAFADAALVLLNIGVVTDTQILNNYKSVATKAQTDLISAQSTLGLAIQTQSAFMESNAIAQAAAANALIQSETAAVVSNQAIAARDQANVIGSTSDPLGIQVGGALNVTAGPTDSFLQVVGNTALNQINATGSVTLISTGAITNGAAPGVPNILATGLNIQAVNGIGTAANPLLTRVGTLNASNTTTGDIDISNTYGAGAALNITGISNTSGGNVVVSNTGNAAAGLGITVSGPISTTGAGTVAINSGSPLTIAANMISASAITLSAGETSSPGDDLTVLPGVAIQSTASSVTLRAGDNVTVPVGSTIEAATTITITGDYNHSAAETTGVNVVVTGTLIAPSAVISVDPTDPSNDTFTITPSVTTPITVTGGLGSDTLNFNADGLPVTIVGNQITAAGRAPVTYSGIEAVHITNAAAAGSVTLNAAAGVADNVVLTGTAPGAGTYTENGGIPITFSGVTSFIFNGADKNDSISISPFATPLQQWGVAVQVDGGGGQNSLTLNGVSGVSENITVQPTAEGVGQVTDINAATGTPVAAVTYVNTKNLSVFGNSGAAGDTDNLFINGTDSANGMTSGNDDAIANFKATANPMLRVYDAGAGAAGGHSPSAAEIADTTGVASTDLFNLQSLSNFSTIHIGLLGGNDLLDLAGAPSGTSTIAFSGGTGDDSLILDSTNGPVLGAINYDGGPGTNYLTLTGGTATSDTYTPGSQLGSGTNTLAFTGGTESVSFQNLAPIFDQVAGPLAVNANNANNAITYREGNNTSNALDPAWGQVSVDTLEPINFINKTNLAINGLAGTDTFSLNNSNTPTSLTGIAINGAPGSGDTLTISGAGVAVSVNTAASTVTGAIGASGAVSVNYSGIGALNLAANVGDLTLTTTGADDTLSVTPGAIGAANTGSLVSSGVAPSITFVNVGALTANLGAGNDAVNVTGTSNNDTIAVSGTAVAVSGRNTVNYTGAESVAVNGLAGSDTFNVTPSATVSINIDGGDPVGVLPGDLLNVVTNPGDTATYFSGPSSDQGGFVVNTNQPISFSHIESVSVSGGGTPVINGTNGNDVINVVARDNTFAGGLDGIQDFTVSVNGGPNLLFVNTPSVAVNGQAGNNQIILQALAPNLAAWNVAVTVDGGIPSVNDQLTVIAPGTDQATYTPDTKSLTGGVLRITNSKGTVATVTLTDIENFTYDGQGGGDTFTVIGNTAANAFTLTPGAANDAGAISMDSTLPVNFQNLGASGQVVVNGNGGADSLVYNGTSANDAFVINSAVVNKTAGGQVNLNSRVPVLTQSIPTLSLEGLAGDDTFNLLTTVAASPYTTLNLDGGATSTATGNVATVTAAASSALTLSGQTVKQGTKTVAGTGLQNINLNGAGNDLTYNYVNGVTEAINVISTPTAAVGQISIPNVALWSFSAVPVVYVNGNAATNDTLTFTGTNNSDIFNAYLNALGTDGSPVLQMTDTSAKPLLTLANYTGFSQLNIYGLDGADTYNVYTAATVSPNSTTVPVSRTLYINGNLPSGKKKLTNLMNVFYTGNRPKIVQSTATQNPTSGLVSLDYGTVKDLIQYDGIQNVVIKKN